MKVNSLKVEIEKIIKREQKNLKFEEFEDILFECILKVILNFQ